MSNQRTAVNLPSLMNVVNPDALGEFLRGVFFDQSDGEFGCYTIFETQSFVHDMDTDQLEAWYAENPEHDPLIEVHGSYFYIGVPPDSPVATAEMYWYWDGDGYLEFRIVFDDEVIRKIYNTDCKKSYGWYEEEINHAG